MYLPDTLISTLQQECGGRLSFVIREVESGAEVGRHPDRSVPTASVYKLFVLLHVAYAVEEGALDWNTRLTLLPEHQSPGTGVLTGLTPGLALSLHDACFLMTTVSDNAATNMILDHVGIEGVNRRLLGLGLRQTRLVPQVRGPGRERLPLATGYTTPRETATLLTSLVRQTCGDSAAIREINTLLAAQADRTMIGRQLLPGWSYAGKTGGDSDLRADVGIVTAPGGGHFVLALFCHDLPILGWGIDHPGVLALAELSRQALSFSGRHHS
ncbi:MAG: serine hydrolase [Deinococcus sp.]